MNVLDLYAGAGGLSLGLERAGSMVYGADNWDASVRVHKENLSGECRLMDCGDIKAVAEYARDIGAEIIVGGPPCQDFSSAGLRKEGKRASLTEAFARLIAEIKPQMFLMENVALARKSQAYARALQIWIDQGYEVVDEVFDAAYYGVPQHRRRLLVIGSRMSGRAQNVLERLKATAARHPMTLRDYFGESLGIDHYYRHPCSYSRRGVFSIDEPSPTLRGVNRPIPPGYVGHRKDSAPIKGLRPLTTLQRAEIQGFPKDWKWPGGNRNQSAEKMIGNAVPIELARRVGEAMLLEI